MNVVLFGEYAQDKWCVEMYMRLLYGNDEKILSQYCICRLTSVFCKYFYALHMIYFIIQYIKMFYLIDITKDSFIPKYQNYVRKVSLYKNAIETDVSTTCKYWQDMSRDAYWLQFIYSITSP